MRAQLADGGPVRIAGHLACLPSCLPACMTLHDPALHLYCVALYRTTAWPGTTLYCMTWYRIVLHDLVPHYYMAWHHIVLHVLVPHCTHGMVLHGPVPEPPPVPDCTMWSCTALYLKDRHRTVQLCT